MERGVAEYHHLSVTHKYSTDCVILFESNVCTRKVTLIRMYWFESRLFVFVVYDTVDGGFTLCLMETILIKNMTFYECQQLSISKLHECFDIFFKLP